MEILLMIKSTSNPLIKRVKRLLNEAHFRNEEREFIIEGAKIVYDALLAELPERPSLNAVIYSPRFTASGNATNLLKMASTEKIPLIEVSDRVMTSMGSLRTDQGIIAIASFIDLPLKEIVGGEFKLMKKPRPGENIPGGPPLFIGACGIQDPGNVGALIRTADAGGATGFLLFEDSADIYNPKSVRGSMGSILSMPFARGLKGMSVISTLRGKGFIIVGTAPQGSKIYTDLDFERPMLVLFGSEGSGLAESYFPLLDEVVSVPIFGGAESLNVNASAALIIYERARRWFER